MSVTQYQTQLLALLPRGSAWPREPESSLGKLMGGLAEEYARVDALLDDIVAESLPSQVTQLIAEWEAEYGLQEDSTDVSTALQDRRNAVVQKYQQYGSQSREFLIAMAAALGFEITITEYTETVFGSDFGGDFYGTDWAFVVQANITTLNASSAATDRLKEVLRRLLHAHKILITDISITRYIAINNSIVAFGGRPLAITEETH